MGSPMELIGPMQHYVADFGDEFKGFLEGKSVLDVACGYGIHGHVIRPRKYYGGHKATIIGCDLSLPLLKILKKHFNPYDNLIHCDVRFMPFRDKIFDIILAGEIIEHLTKEEAIKLIHTLERLCRMRIVLTAPNGFMKGVRPHGPLDAHISGWHLTN